MDDFEAAQRERLSVPVAELERYSIRLSMGFGSPVPSRNYRRYTGRRPGDGRRVNLPGWLTVLLATGEVARRSPRVRSSAAGSPILTIPCRRAQNSAPLQALEDCK